MKILELLEAQNYGRISDPALRWLAKYTYENLDKYPPREYLDQLLNEFPCEAGTYYRGMNFYSQQAWDKFISKFDGQSEQVLEMNGVSSWTNSAGSAEQFAVTQPTYFLNREVMVAADVQRKTKERLSGYRGVILSTHVNQGAGIDVNATGVGHESEVVLPPGKYMIRIHHVIKRYEHQLADGETTPEQVILNTTKESLKSKSDLTDHSFFDYVMHHYKDQLSDQARKHIYSLYAPEPTKPIFVYQAEPTASYGTPTNKVRLDVWTPALPLFRLYEQGLFTDPKIKNKIVSMARMVLKQALPVLEKYIAQAEHYNPGILRLTAQVAGQEPLLQAVISKTVGAEIRKVQAGVRDINKIADPDKKMAAIRQHGEDMAALLKMV